MDQKPEFSEVLEVASEAGHILLENGAEISRVEDIMERIAAHYGVSSRHFFVLSNGIFTTGQAEKVQVAGGQAATYANVEFIPLKGIQLSKVKAVNRLSYDIAAGKCTLEQARERLAAIRNMPAKPVWEETLGAAFGAAGFAIVFGGGFMDCLVAFVMGLLLQLFCIFVSSKYLSKIVGGVCNALVVTLLCILSWRIGLGVSLSNVIIGAIMPLIPGVPFVNGVRDLANSDYIAGLTRLTDAMLGFFCIALGVSLSFIIDGAINGGVIPLEGVRINPETSSILIQTIAAFVGTTAFACLFGVDREQYLSTGLVGALGWLSYLLLVRYAGATAPVGTLLSALLVAIFSRILAVPSRCPAQVFLLCGIFPLVPGAGIFWFTYYLATERIALSLSSGFVAVKVSIAIVLGIILAMELPQRLFSHPKKVH